MSQFTFLFILAGIWMIFASVHDFKTTEIPNWLNFSLVIFALGFRFFYSFFAAPNFSFFYQGLIGYVIFFALSNLFYYMRVFAGGDARLFAALGAVLPVFPTFLGNLGAFIDYIFLFLLVGAAYGIIASVVVSLKNFKRFKNGFNQLFQKEKKRMILYESFAILFLVLGFFVKPLFYFGVFIFVFPYFYLFIKSVDEYCMVKLISPEDLIPGDLLYEDVKVGKKTIKADWQGVDKEDIPLLKKKKKILVKYGIVYSPVFLLSFIVFWINLGSPFYNLLMNAFGI